MLLPRSKFIPNTTCKESLEIIKLRSDVLKTDVKRAQKRKRRTPEDYIRMQ